MSRDIADILKRFNQLSEGLTADQNKAKQLPALFKPRSISVLNSPADPKHPMDGYAVGANESVGSDGRDPFDQGWRTWFRRGDVSDNPYEPGTAEHKEWLNGYEEGRAQPDHYNESTGRVRGTHGILEGIVEAERNEMDTPAVQAALKKMAERHKGEKWTKEQLAALGKRLAARQQKPVKEAVATEDVISQLKDKLGDYLADISKEIKKDPDLIDKLAAKPAGDEIGPPVKKITTDDGHEISIHGNEDDGFRVSIKNKPAKAKFESLDHAVMACEMYCARRRGTMAGQSPNNDYLDEA